MGAAQGSTATLKDRSGQSVFTYKPMHISPDVISIVLEFLPSVKQTLRLRLVSRAFDTAAYRISLIKLH